MTARWRALRTPESRLTGRSAVVAALAVAALAWLTLGGGSVGYDAAYALVWGEDLLAGRLPDYGGPVAPTPHPLLTALAVPASLLGAGADEALLAVAHVALGALVVAGALLATRVAGPLAGAVAAAVLLTRASVADNTLDAGIDIAFSAFVIGALAVEAAAPRNGVRVLTLLALAGTLRPDAWLLSLAYLTYILCGRREAGPAEHGPPERERRWRLVLLAAAAPIIWMSWDLFVTGDPLYSLTSTRELASELERPRGAGIAVELLPQYLVNLSGGAVAWLGLIGALTALWLAQERSGPAVAVLLLGCLAFLVLGVAELPLIIRYAFLPAILLCVFCGVVAALPRLAPGRRGAAAACGVVVGVLLALEVPDQLRRGDHVRAASFARADIQSDLERLAALPAVREAVRMCPRVWSQSHRPLPLLALWLDRPMGSFQTGTPDGDDRGVVIEPANVEVAQQFRLRGADGRIAPAALTPAFVEVGRTTSWRAYLRCD